MGAGVTSAARCAGDAAVASRCRAMRQYDAANRGFRRNMSRVRSSRGRGEGTGAEIDTISPLGFGVYGLGFRV